MANLDEDKVEGGISRRKIYGCLGPSGRPSEGAFGSPGARTRPLRCGSRRFSRPFSGLVPWASRSHSRQ